MRTFYQNLLKELGVFAGLHNKRENMGHHMRLSLLAISLFINSLFYSSSHAASVRYAVTFTGSWTADQSSSYPANAHFTQLVGATHGPGLAFWRSGDLATGGVASVAELGFNSPLFTELQSARNNGQNIGPDILISDLFNLPNSTSLEIEVDDSRPFITLISMVAPSPDWFVGVSGLKLRDNGQWRSSFSIDLKPYDAGTEEGNVFSLSNPPSNPPQAIAPIGDSPFFEAAPTLGRLSFRLLTPIQPPKPDTDNTTATMVNLSGILPLLLD